MDSSHASGSSDHGAQPARCATGAESGTPPKNAARALDVEISVAAAVARGANAMTIRPGITDPPNVKYRVAGRGASIGGMPIGRRRRAWRGATLALVVCAAASTGVAWASAAASPRMLSDADNGQTVTVNVGTTLRLVLHSTYWRMGASSARSVVAASGSPRYASRPGRCRER